MLDRIVKEQWLQAHGVAAIWPANTVARRRYRTLRRCIAQQGHRSFPHTAPAIKKAPGVPYIASPTSSPRSGTPDFLGGFAVTAGHGVDERVKRFEAAHDDYSAILLKALADRLAEAFAEKLHEVVRKELWGYETVKPQQRAADQGGVRRHPSGTGLPACPDHTEKPELFRLLDAEKHTGITLTEVWP
jgi:5-methyltetrahydrofolate--homocysteine methyltransferase